MQCSFGLRFDGIQAKPMSDQDEFSARNKGLLKPGSTTLDQLKMHTAECGVLQNNVLEPKHAKSQTTPGHSRMRTQMLRATDTITRGTAVRWHCWSQPFLA